MTDTSRETWQKIQNGECPRCAAPVEPQTDEAEDRETGGLLGVVGCANGHRFALYLSGDGHGVDELPS